MNSAVFCSDMFYRTRRFFSVFCFVFFVGLHPANGFSNTKDRLLVFSWADYIDPELVSKFEQQSGVEVEIAHFNSDDERNTVLSEGDGQGIDLVMMSGESLKLFSEQNIFAKPTPENIPNLEHIEPKWRDAFDGARDYGVPYFWGTLGIAYRKDLYPAGLSTWKEFFDPPPELHGKISLIKSSRDLYGMALKSLGHSINTNDPELLREAHAVLNKQKPHVKTYDYLAHSEKSGLVQGQILAAMMYNGDALMQQEHNENIEFVIPDEGTNLWVDYFVILRSSTRKQLAEQFLNFLNEPRNATENAEFVYFASPNRMVDQLASKDYRDNRVIHPTEAVMENSETLLNLSPRAHKTINGYFADIVD